MSRRTPLSLLLPLVLLGGCSTPRTAAPPSAATLADDLELVTPRVSLGRTVPGGYVTGTLQVRAKDRAATLTQVEPTCGCTISHAALPAALAPGQVFEAPIAMDLARLPSLGAKKEGGPNTVERQIVVASERGAKLTALAAVDVTDRVLIEPAQLRFGSIAPGMSSSAACVVTAPAGAPRPKVLAVVTDRPDIASTIEPSADGTTRVGLTWTPSAPGEMDAFVHVKLDDPKDPDIGVRVQGRCEALVTVEPSRIENLAAPTSRPVVVTVTLRRVDEQPLNILGARCTSHRVEMEVQAGDGPMRQIHLVIPVLPLPGEINAEVVVRTDAPGSGTIEIPIRVRAAG